MFVVWTWGPNMDPYNAYLVTTTCCVGDDNAPQLPDKVLAPNEAEKTMDQCDSRRHYLGTSPHV